MKLAPYQSARTLNAFDPGRVYLDANEMPFEPPVMPVDFSQLQHYADEGPRRLTEAYAAYAELPPGRVLATRGIDEGVDLLIRAYCEPGSDDILVQPPTYGMYGVAAATHRCSVRHVPLQPGGGVDRTAAAFTERSPRIVFVCRPNNPTGTLCPREDVLWLLQTVDPGSLVAVDEAYIEFCADESVADLLPAHPNLVVLRTLSKGFGLAGLHVGFVLAHPAIIDALNRISNPYPIPDPCAQIALAALSPDGIERMREHCARVVATRDQFAEALRAARCCKEVVASSANYILARFESADAVYDALFAAGIVVRRLSQDLAGSEWLRFSIGRRSDMERAAEIIGGL